jgi:hypothetical protein
MPAGPASRRWRFAAAAGVLVALVAGCSQASDPGHANGSSGPTPQQAIQLAAAHTKLVNSLTATFSAQGSGSAAISMAGTLSEQIHPRLLAEADIPTVTALGQTMPGGIKEILTGQAIYMRLGALSQLPGGKSWLELPFSELGKAAGGVNLGQIVQQAQNSDPLQQTRLLTGANGVHKVGTSTINGVPVTEYAGYYTIQAAAERLPASSRAGFEQAAAKAGLTGADFRIWLDDQQLPRKLELTEHGSVESLAMTIVVTSINQPVSVQLPPASQTAVLPLSALTPGN